MTSTKSPYKVSYRGKTYVLSELVSTKSSRVTLEVDGRFGPRAEEVILSVLGTIKVRNPLTIPVKVGEKDGYDRKNKAVSVSTKTLARPRRLRTVFPQLLGIYFWENVLGNKGRKAYTSTIADLPGGEGTPSDPGKGLFSKDPLKDFAFSFEKFWRGALKDPRKKLLHGLLVKTKGQWQPRDLASRMSGPRNPGERPTPIPSFPLAPNPDSQFG